ENYEIRGNTFSMEGPTNSGKGNMLLTESEGPGVIADNTFIAGNYAIGLDSANVTIEGNHFIGHDSASWTAAINMGSGQSHNIMIRDNYFDGDLRGISLFELTGEWADTPVIRSNMTIQDNIFRVSGPTMEIGGPVQFSGSFTGNTIVGSSALPWSGSQWSVTNNTYTSKVPAWNGGAGSYEPIEVIRGTDGDDILIGTDGADTIWGD